LRHKKGFSSGTVLTSNTIMKLEDLIVIEIAPKVQAVVMATESVWNFTDAETIGKIISRNSKSFNSDDAASEILGSSVKKTNRSNKREKNRVVGVIYFSK